MRIGENTSLEELLQISKLTISDLQSGEEFIVKDLFKGFEWNRISKGNRTKLGSLFFAYSKNEASSTLTILGKTPQNQQRYKKI
jgi:hypothetical protein